jgi:hypothetical protein
VRCLVAARNDNAAARPARTDDTTAVPTLGDAAVGASGTSSDSLPDNLAVIAETELVGTVADYGTVLSASTSQSSSRWG